jgi:excisionase family DNA binding protein
MYDDQVMTRTQAARHLTISASTLKRRVGEGRFREHKIGRLARYYRSELDEDVKKAAPERDLRRRCDRKRDEMEAFLFD